MARASCLLGPFTAVLLVTGCAKAPAPVEPSAPVEPPAPPALAGAWRSSLQFESGAFAPIKDLEFMYVFNTGGTMTESSNYDGAPPVPPAYGVWRNVEPNEFEAKYEYYATAPAAAAEFMKGAGRTDRGRCRSEGESGENPVLNESLGRWSQGNPVTLRRTGRRP